MTYKELLDKLKSLSNDQLDQTVTVFHGSTDEFYPAHSTGITHENDILDANHFYLEID